MDRLREALLEVVTPADLAAIAKELVQAARGGDVAAAKVVFDVTLGPQSRPDERHRYHPDLYKVFIDDI